MTTVAHVFQDAVRTASSHRKNIVVLRKLHLKQGTLIESDFWQCLLHIMPVQKGNAEAERAVKFLAAYLEAMDQDVNGKGVPANATELKSSLVHKLLFQTLRGARAKDKVVRYRVCQIVAVLLNQVDELESDEAYFMIRDHLMERTRDKEATVRVQAATSSFPASGIFLLP
ncbi:hypothetical protein DFS34DRAFT_654137 [Phlyctochytrium arcticum]|nr:hypothetical protein DFS34DRAFT_654137 [Phlyctochytrium arcticum]